MRQVCQMEWTPPLPACCESWKVLPGLPGCLYLRQLQLLAKEFELNP